MTVDASSFVPGVFIVRAVVTATRPGYRRGQTVCRTSPAIVPREAVYRSRQACGQYRIRAYDWAALIQQHNIPVA